MSAATKEFGPHVQFEARAFSAAQSVIAAMMEFGPVGPLGIAPDLMPTRELSEMTAAVREAWDDGCRGFAEILPHALRKAKTQDEQDSVRVRFVDASQSPYMRPEKMGPDVAAVVEYHQIRRRWELGQALAAAAGDHAASARIIEQLQSIEGTDAPGLQEQLAARAFDFSARIDPPIPRLRLCGHSLFTPGNIGVFQAPPKQGKSGAISAVLSAPIAGRRVGADTLGFEADNDERHALIHFDTEQSRFDHDSLVRRSLRRAKATEPPEWLMSYSVADLSVMERREALRIAMRDGKAKHGGVFAVVIDGIGDLCADPNDSEESFDLVAELHWLAITYDCAIITVLHENPGSESGKTRGHLGSQLERKAETNLRLAKDKDGITTMWAERARHCYLPKEQGHCFQWSDTEKMHVSCGSAGEIRQSEKREKMIAEALSSYAGEDSMSFTQLEQAIMSALTLKERSAALRIKAWAAEGIIRKDAAGNYHLIDP
jgi:hypothetical protein